MVNVSKRDMEALDRLTKIIGPSGCEEEVQKYWGGLMKPYVDSVRRDSIGNCYAVKGGKRAFPKLMFNAHADTIGFQVVEIEEGFVFTKDLYFWGQVDHRCLPGSGARVVSSKTGDVFLGNFVPPKPVHILSDGELQVSPERHDVGIDLGGVGGGSWVKKAVSIGDYAVLDGEFRVFGPKEDFVSSHSLDNRLGLWMMYQTAKRLKGKKGPVCFVSTVSEEVGDFLGAEVSARKVRPDVSITLDATVSTDHILEIDSTERAKKYGKISLGKGPALPRGPGINEKIHFILQDLAKKRVSRRELAYQVEAGGSCSAENSKIIGVGNGVRTAGIFVPLRNMHSPIETAYMPDVENAIELCVRACNSYSKGNFK